MTSSGRPDVTAILNLSREGLLAHNSLRSLVDACATAQVYDVRVEIVVVADRPDDATLEYLETAESVGASVLRVDEGDLGLARNAGVERAEGRYVAFLDGDDLWGRHWLARAFHTASAVAEPTVWHPEANLFFGTDVSPYWYLHHDVDTEEGDWTTLALRNHWTSLSFAPRDVYRLIPYRAAMLDRGFGYEDWCWNAETIGHGVPHRHVPGTVHLVRRRPRSLVQRTAATGALVTPNALFRERAGMLAGG